MNDISKSSALLISEELPVVLDCFIPAAGSQWPGLANWILSVGTWMHLPISDCCDIRKEFGVL